MLDQEQIEFVVANIKQDAVREFVADEFMPCIAAASRRAIRNGFVSYDDFVQEGRLGIITALDRFNGDKTTFVSFMVQYIRGYINHATYKRRNTENSMSTSIDDVVSQSENEDKKYSDFITDKNVNTEEDLKRADEFKFAIKLTENLSAIEREVVIKYYLDDMTLKEISEQVYYTIPGVKSIRDRALLKLRQSFNTKPQSEKIAC
jgi:RNA polymerase sigma factor (sigma-70 family)